MNKPLAASFNPILSSEVKTLVNVKSDILEFDQREQFF